MQYRKQTGEEVFCWDELMKNEINISEFSDNVFERYINFDIDIHRHSKTLDKHLAVLLNPKFCKLTITKTKEALSKKDYKRLAVIFHYFYDIYDNYNFYDKGNYFVKFVISLYNIYNPSKEDKSNEDTINKAFILYNNSYDGAFPLRILLELWLIYWNNLSAIMIKNKFITEIERSQILVSFTELVSNRSNYSFFEIIVIISNYFLPFELMLSSFTNIRKHIPNRIYSNEMFNYTNDLTTKHRMTVKEAIEATLNKYNFPIDKYDSYRTRYFFHLRNK